MAEASLISGTWNLEWARPTGSRGKWVSQILSAARPDILCLTEAFEACVPVGGSSLTCGYGNLYADRIGGKKVILWSRYRWTERIQPEVGTLFGSRFAAGIVETPIGRLRVVGVCIPYANSRHTAASTRWQDHQEYLEQLQAFLDADRSVPTMLLGDFNQTIPRKSQPQRVFQALMRLLTGDMTVATAGLADSEGEQTIDHVACSSRLRFGAEGIFPKTIDGRRLSDHFGIFGTLEKRS